MTWQFDPSGLWITLSVVAMILVIAAVLGMALYWTQPDNRRVVQGRLPSMQIEVLGRVPLGEHIWVEDHDTGERVEAVALRHAEDSQATFTRVQLHPRRQGWPHSPQRSK